MIKKFKIGKIFDKKSNTIISKKDIIKSYTFDDNKITGLNKLVYLLNNLTSFSFPSIEEYSFRGSSLPFCGMRKLLNVILNTLNLENRKNYNLKNDLIFGFGNFVHSTIQKWLGLSGFMYGDWVCEQSYCSNRFQKIRGFNNICPSCNSLMTYKELTFKIGKYFTSHPDGLIFFDKNEKNKGYILEIKTTNNIENNNVELSYGYQSSVYPVVLRRKGYNILGTLMLYIDKKEIANGHLKTKMIYVPYNKEMENIFDYFYNKNDNVQKIFNKKVNNVDFNSLRICSNKEHYDQLFNGSYWGKCPYYSTCFSDKEVNRLYNLYKDTCNK